MGCLDSSPITPFCGDAWKTSWNTITQTYGATKVPI
jgi:hypothetical protein